MHCQRFISFLLAVVIAVATCAPIHATGTAAALRGGRHVSRAFDEALDFGRTRAPRHGDTGQHSWNVRVWSAGADVILVPPCAARRTPAVRSVDTLPGHWGARHLII